MIDEGNKNSRRLDGTRPRKALRKKRRLRVSAPQYTILEPSPWAQIKPMPAFTREYSNRDDITVYRCSGIEIQSEKPVPARI